PEAEGTFAWLAGPWLESSACDAPNVVGWAAMPSDDPASHLVVLLNLEAREVSLELRFPRPGLWLRLADLERVEDIPPHGTNGPDDPLALRVTDEPLRDHRLPPLSGQVYKFHGP
ncbi:MAG: 1,4-alpha-glucan branching protein, partial [Armatimonadetes bacterium]|nr:1,4-alpha-glucan branching protein [Armatimonadota bacterium]